MILNEKLCQRSNCDPMCQITGTCRARVQLEEVNLLEKEGLPAGVVKIMRQQIAERAKRVGCPNPPFNQKLY